MLTGAAPCEIAVAETPRDMERIAFGLAVVACMVSIILKQYRFDLPATVVILGAVGAICVYICGIMFKGAANELREKKASQKIAA
jgi:hypothetical protein